MIAKVVLLAAFAAMCIAKPPKAPVEAEESEASPEEKFVAQPYEFGFETDDGYGTTTFRKESSDDKGTVEGSYGYKDQNGIERVVKYIADDKGYRAEIKTNEPGTESQNPADVVLHAEPIIMEEPKYKSAAPHYSAAQPQYYAHQDVYYKPQPQYYAPQPHYSAPEPQYNPYYPQY